MSVDVAAIREALKKATEGAWSADPDAGLGVGEGEDWRLIGELDFRSDAKLIVLLRNNAEALLDELERVQAASEGVDMLVAQAERRGAVKALRSLADWMYPVPASFRVDQRADEIESGAEF